MTSELADFELKQFDVSRDPEAHPGYDSKLGPEDIAEYMSNLHNEVEQAHDSLDEKRTREDMYYRKRYGMWPEKTYPWPKASNLHIPYTDKIIRKIKPQLVALTYKSNPVAEFVPVGDEDHAKTERAQNFFNWLWLVRMRPSYKAVVRMADAMCESGRAFLKPVYRQEIEPVVETYDLTDMDQEVQEMLASGQLEEVKGGIEKIMTVFRAEFGVDQDTAEKIYAEYKQAGNANGSQIVIHLGEKKVRDEPFLIMREDRDIVLPQGCRDVQDAEWVCDRGIVITERELLRDYASGKYDNKEAVDMLLTSAFDKDGEKEEYENTRDDREGYAPNDERLYTLNEVYCYKDLGFGFQERCVVTYNKHFPEHPIRFKRYKYDHPGLRWGIVQFDFEITSGTHAGPRGVCEMLDGLQTELVTNHNMKLDMRTITITPVYKAKVNYGFSADDMRMFPGQFIPVEDHDDIVPLTQPNHDINFEREEMTLKNWGEEFIGVTDFGVGQLSNGSSRRTAREISQVATSSGQLFELDATTWNMNMADVFYLVYCLWIQFGPDEVYSGVMEPDEPVDEQQVAQMQQQLGGPGGFQVDQPPQPGGGQQQPPKMRPVKTRKRDIAGRFHMVPVGTLSNTNPAYVQQQKSIIYQEFKGNPLAKQRELMKMLADEMVPRYANKILKSKEQIAAEAQAAQQQAMSMQGGSGGNQQQSTPRETNIVG